MSEEDKKAEETRVNLVNKIADIGAKYPLKPPVHGVKSFEHFFSDGELDFEKINEKDGSCTRRELIARFLLLCAVLDQGPDIEGVRALLMKVVNRLYEDEIRIFHTPLEFFRELHISVDEIWENHELIKEEKSAEWARINQSSAGKYNLFMDNSRQTLNYAVFRWGTPLALPYLLSRKCEEERQSTALLDYLESFPSAEDMSRQLKDDTTYGLGKSIGDKACHLFAKWIVSTFRLARRSNSDNGWGEYSYEVPYDSNAGRVLWRTGYLLGLASEKSYEDGNVLQPGAGKGGTTYIRVTDIRGMKVETVVSDTVKVKYFDLCVNHLKTHKKGPKKIEIQRLQHAFLMLSGKSVANFDDGLIHIGRTYCYNHDNPACGECPLKSQCAGATNSPKLIADYRT